MRAGTLRHRIVVERPTVANDRGIPSKTWASVGQRWASITPLVGRELEFAKSTHADVTHKITCRYIDANAKDRITFNGRTLEIISALNTDERNIETVIMAKQVV